MRVSALIEKYTMQGARAMHDYSHPPSPGPDRSQIESFVLALFSTPRRTTRSRCARSSKTVPARHSGSHHTSSTAISMR